jgi:hypothetical protein
MGRPNSKEQLESVLQRISNAFHQLANCQATREHFGPIAKVSQKWTIGVRFPARPTGAGWTLLITVVGLLRRADARSTGK